MHRIGSSTDGLTAERTNAFVTLVFGYSVVALLFQNKAPFGINAYDVHSGNTAWPLADIFSFFGKAVLGLIQAFSFNWLYFEIGEYERTPRNPNRDSKLVS